ncbi:MAG: signal peptidase I [Clostridia bacterium]|nr:signal peptidase I [Clostridia bacterium]
MKDNEKSNAVKKPVWKRVISIVIDIILVVYLLFSVCVVLMSLSTSKNGVPTVFGYTVNSIKSPSMEPLFYRGDLILCKTDVKEDNLSKGDIIAFWGEDVNKDGSPDIIVHRITDIEGKGSSMIITTKGDDNPGPDEQTLAYDKIIARYSREGKDDGILIKGGGKVIDFIISSNGILFLLVIPLALFFFYALFKFVKALVEYKYSKNITNGDNLTEAQKQKAIEEYLLKQKSETENNAASQEINDGKE